MPISTDLNIAPYNDDFDPKKQFHRILFKPSYAVQARELTQLQSILQDQLEQFGSNIFQEGSIVKGCNFTELNTLKYVKLTDKTGFDPTAYVGSTLSDGTEITYILEGQVTGLQALVISASRGFETRSPDLNTFYINYLNTNTVSSNVYKVFQPGETLNIRLVRTLGSTVLPQQAGDASVNTINVTLQSNSTGNSFGLSSAEGVIFQKGNFLYAAAQLVIVSKYTNLPDGVSVGYYVNESIVTALQDSSLYDNSIGSPNVNAPGADRLKLVPVLTVISTAVADADPTFFTLARYANGAAIQIRDVSQYNVIGQELARRTYEESGDFITSNFGISTVDQGNTISAAIGAGTAYIKGYRVETKGTQYLTIDQITSTANQVNQPVSFNYGGYVDIQSINGTVSIGSNNRANLSDANNVIIGSAIIENITPTQVFLFDINMGANNFSNVRHIKGSSGTITISNTIKNKSSAPMVFDTGVFSLKTTTNTSIPVRRSSNVAIANTANSQVTLIASSGEDFAVDNSDLVLIDSTNVNLIISSYVVSSNNNVLTINLATGQTFSANGTLYFNSRIQSATPYNKQATNVYIKTTYDSANTKYNLGFPDVYEIVSITDSSNTNVTNSFKLIPNQKDHYYDHSYIEYIPSSPTPAAGLLTVNMNVYQLNTTTGIGFFTVDSYPVGMSSNRIPTYVSSSGKTYDLRDSFDFRPYTNALGSYTASTPASAPTIASTIELTPVFSNPIVIPALNGVSQSDFEIYNKRIDSIVIDSYGAVSIVKGKETINPVPPTISKGLKIGDVSIPGYPAVSPQTANALNVPKYAITATSKGVMTYTMSDINDIKKTVDDLRYYVVLSQLEQQTQNMNILDANGLTRFKNGIIVDPFNDLSIANLSSTEFNAAIDSTEKSLTPSVKTFPISLKYDTSSNTSIFPSSINPNIATLQRTANISVVNQPYATDYRNCVSNFYHYNGTGFISPSYDSSYDVVNNPLQINIDTTTPISNLVNALQNYIPLTTTSSKVLSSSTALSTNTVGNIQTTTSTLTRNIATTVTSLQTSATTNEQKVGDFVTNINFNPYMRSKDIKIYMTGLRPSTQHYVYFDTSSVAQNTAPGDSIAITASDVQMGGNYGDPIFTDANGVLRAIFTIPENTFYVGSRNIEIADVDVYTNIGSASTSYGFITYNAYNYSVDTSSLSVSTRAPQTSVIATTTNNTVVNKSVTNSFLVQHESGTNNWGVQNRDPLAQTFFIKSAMCAGAPDLFVSQIDLYFKRASTTNGVTIMLREVSNGYPSYNIIPYSRVHLTPSQVNVSNTGTVATTVTFEAPVRLNAETEYAIVVEPDAGDPNYLIFTSKVGDTDLATGNVITRDWGDGVLFTSTNNRAWQSYQDEDIKFTLYRHDFTASSGSVTLTNDDNEFLTLNNPINKFKAGENVYSFTSSTPTSVSVTSGNNYINGTNTDFTATYAVGDYLIVEGTSSNTIFKVAAITPTQITADRPALFTGTFNSYPIVVATIANYDYRNPYKLILEGSSATSSKYFAANNMVYGLTSRASANVTSVDNIELSYIQPMILKTTDAVTDVTMSGTFTNPSNVTTSYTIPISFNDKTLFNTNGVIVYSKSNDPTRSKPFFITMNMINNTYSTTTPFIDLESASLLAYQYNVSNNSSTTSKYVSETIELAENFDAEDFTIYVTQYRPVNSDVKVYLRVQNVYDPQAFESNPWILLTPTSNTYSSTSNTNDFREVVYNVPAANKDALGKITYTNSSGTYEGFRKFAVKIELNVNNVNGRYPIANAPRILDYRGIALT